MQRNQPNSMVNMNRVYSASRLTNQQSQNDMLYTPYGNIRENNFTQVEQFPATNHLNMIINPIQFSNKQA